MSALPQCAVARPSLALLGVANTGPQGDLDAWLADLASEVLSLLARHDKPATLIGWSLGGLHAREVAKRHIEVDSSHVGMGWNRQVLQVVQERLLRRTGPWRRYVQAT